MTESSFRHRAASLLLLACLVGVGGCGVALSWLFFGPINTIIYTVLFLVGAGGVVGIVAVLGGMTPSTLGPLLFALGQLAFGEGWLVQYDGVWRMHPGKTEGGERMVWLHEGWQVVEDDEAMSILGFRPFGILWDKTGEALADARADPAAEATAATDGGMQEVERGGYDTTRLPVDVSGQDGTWVLALHRYWSRGLDQLGNIALLQRVEEVTLRKESGGRQPSTKSTIYATAFGILMGALTGALAMGVF